MKDERQKGQAEEEYSVQAGSQHSQHSLHPGLPGSVGAFRVYEGVLESPVVSLLQITPRLKAGQELGQITAHFIASFPICKQDDNNCPQTSKGGDDENDLKNNNPLLGSYYGSNTMQDTLHALCLILINLQGM